MEGSRLAEEVSVDEAYTVEPRRLGLGRRAALQYRRD